jgi:hypothetical protein
MVVDYVKVNLESVREEDRLRISLHVSKAEVKFNVEYGLYVKVSS